jgi:hypothetical protein
LLFPLLVLPLDETEREAERERERGPFPPGFLNDSTRLMNLMGAEGDGVEARVGSALRERTGEGKGESVLMEGQERGSRRLVDGGVECGRSKAGVEGVAGRELMYVVQLSVVLLLW